MLREAQAILLHGSPHYPLATPLGGIWPRWENVDVVCHLPNWLQGRQSFLLQFDWCDSRSVVYRSGWRTNQIVKSQEALKFYKLRAANERGIVMKQVQQIFNDPEYTILKKV